ncbi:aldo/keto reductase [Lacihabitans sp. CCS-44]|uniref:aldo/keto reductase n=1 Tax=Lacihabitans sp. CCS-44 TaxID=2487331 RepID=UPI0020CF1632|nr:aldo/keto reductase [Lacihabitans sp. CCS-44]MCP9755211.1 aldo/keto reductase [Lacihabitans sp. CCS-44]
MKKIYLSDSGPKVSKAIYSFWRWENESGLTDEVAKNVIEHCVSLGINTFDLGNYETSSNSQKIFFNEINKLGLKRQDVVLFAKFGLQKKNGVEYFNNSRSFLLESLDKFLAAQNLDYIDIFLLEGLDFISDLEEIGATLEYIVHTGKAKHIGIANLNNSQHKLLSKFLSIPIVTSHIEMNLLKPDAIFDGRLDFIKETYSKPLVWAPLAGGEILSGGSEKAIKIRKILNEIAQKQNVNIEQLAVAWLIQLGALPIIGSLSLERITNAAQATEVKLSHEDWYKVFSVVK